MGKIVNVKCEKCNGTGRIFKHSETHEANQHLSCWRCGCGNVDCPECNGTGKIEAELW
jgi:DnaJ-class molecular chaperone